MARIFVSYSRTDEAFARQLATSLSNLGADVWIDVEDIPVGMKWSRAIQDGLDVSDVLLVVISPESMASHNVEDEWQYYLDQKKPVIPLLYKPAKLHFQLSRIQYVDFNRLPYDKAVRQLHAELGRKGVHLNPLPRHSTLTQPVMRVTGAASHEPARRTFPITWLAAGAVLLVVGVGLGLFLSNPDRLGLRPGTPTDDQSAGIVPTHTPQQAAAPTHSPTQAIAPTDPPINTGAHAIYDADGLYFQYPRGWLSQRITQDGENSVLVGNNQAVLNLWQSEGFGLANPVTSGQSILAIIPNIEDVVGLGDGYTIWQLTDLLRQSVASSGDLIFSDIFEHPAKIGQAAYTLGSSTTFSVELLVINTGGNRAGFILILGAAALDQVVDMTTAAALVAETLEVR